MKIIKYSKIFLMVTFILIFFNLWYASLTYLNNKEAISFIQAYILRGFPFLVYTFFFIVMSLYFKTMKR